MTDLSCDYCGKEFGNQGGLATHKAHCDERPQPGQGDPDAQPTQSEPQPRNPQQPQQQRQQNPPAQPQQGAQASQQGQPPAQPPANTQQGQQGGELASMSAEDSVATGMQMGSLLAGSASGDPEQQAQAKGKMLQAVAGAVSKMGQHVAQQGTEQHQRAKQNASRSTTTTTDYPTCADCGGQLTQIPPEADQGEPFPCQHCGAMLEFE